MGDNLITTWLSSWEFWAWLIGGGSGLCGAIFGFVRLGVNLHKAYSTLNSIADQFSTNSGSTMKDSINRIEHGLVRMNGMVQRIVSDLALAVIQTDEHGYCVWVSPEWRYLTGLTLEEALGHGWKAAIHPQDRPAVTADWAAAVAEARMFRMRFRITPDAKVAWVDCEIVPIFAVHGKVTVGMIGSFTPVKAEEIVVVDKITESTVASAERMAARLQ
jgi:PAS domain S-box-containing protein